MKNIETLGITKSGSYLLYNIQSYLNIKSFIEFDIFIKLDTIKILKYNTYGIIVFTGIINTQQRRMFEVADDLHLIKESGTLAFKLGDRVRIHNVDQNVFTCM